MLVAVNFLVYINWKSIWNLSEDSVSKPTGTRLIFFLLFECISDFFSTDLIVVSVPFLLELKNRN